MYKRVFIVILSLLLCFNASAGEVLKDLLHLDESIRSDSVLKWYKDNVREKDSAFAFQFFDKLDRLAKTEKSAFGRAEVLFLKGQYVSMRLKRLEEGIAYMQKAIDLAKAAKLNYDWADYTFNLGIIYFAEDKVPLAIECLIRAHEKFSELDYEHNKNAGNYLYNIGWVYYHLRNYKEALKYLLQARHYSSPDFWISEQTENTTGLAYFELGKPDSAIYYYSKTLDIAAKNGDTAWMGIANGNMGDIYMQQKDYNKAYEYYNKYYEVCKIRHAHGINGNTAGALTSLAEINIIRKNTALAMAQLTEANTIIESEGNAYYPRKAALYHAFAQLYSLKGDYANAYKYLLLNKEVSDSMARKENALRYVNVQQQLESEKHLARINLLEAQKRAEKQKQYFYLSGLIALALIGLLLYNRYRLKTQKDLEIKDKQAKLLTSEKLRTEEELKSAQSLLDQYIKSIAEKNELIQEVTEQLNYVSQQTSEPVRFEYIQQLSDATLLTDEDWSRFKELFTKVHKGFFIKLKEKAPDLTEADMRLLALTKLNISTRQMAQMLGISPSSVHTARYRLRKKMSLPEENQLEELVGQI